MLDRYIFILLLTVFIVLTAVFCVKSGQSKNHKLWRAHVMLGATSVALLANAVVVMSQFPTLSYVFYAVYYATFDVAVFFFLRFCTEFTGTRKIHPTRLLVLKILIIIDSILCFANIFVHFYFTISQHFINGENYYKPTFLAPYYFHVAISTFMILSSVAILIIKLFNSAHIYWDKYGPILILVILMTALNMCHGSFGWATDKSVLIYALVVLGIYRNAIIYSPDELVHSAMMTFASGLNDALAVVDCDENCIYANELARTLLGLQKGDLDGTDLLHNWCGGKKCIDTPDFVKYVDFKLDEKSEDKPRHLKIYYRRMIDTHGRFEGSTFQIRDLTDEINHIEQDKYRATHDSLTGLYNRDWFTILCENEFKKNPYNDYVMVCLDIGNFKFVNDLFGPQVGDQVLNSIGEEIVKRAYPEDIYGRMENDHFAILMHRDRFEISQFEETEEKMSGVLEDLNFPLTIYVGAYHVTDKTIPISVMCDRAHMAIDTVKGKAGKTIAVYTEDIRASRLKRQDIISGLDAAIENGEIKIYLQAQTDYEGKSHGAEALVRWGREDGSMVYPNEFIPVLEDSGAIAKLDMRVWELACIELKKWQDAGIDDYYISVNISPKDFYYIDLYKHFTGLVKKYGIPAKKLRLEITETAIMMNLNRQLEVISSLRNAGFIMEIDDFGSGYSSLNMLKDIRVDVLKIDMAFLGKSDDDIRSRDILEYIVGLARTLDMDVIVEGVETKEHLEMMKSMGCETYQGYYFSKPIPVDMYEEQYM